MRRQALVVLLALVLVRCNPEVPGVSCLTDLDCLGESYCLDGICIAGLRDSGGLTDAGTSDSGTPDSGPGVDGGRDGGGTNHAPTAVCAGPNPIRPGEVVTLSGTGSSDPDGDTLVYAWAQTGTPQVSLSSPTSATTQFTAPYVSADATLNFTLTVRDPGGLSNSKVCALTLEAMVYVSRSRGSDGGKGTKTSPFATVAKGVSAASAWPGSTVFVDQGVYSESALQIPAGVSLQCSYDAANGWARSAAVTTTLQIPGASGVQFTGNSAAGSTVDRCALVATSSGAGTTAYTFVQASASASASLVDTSVDGTALNGSSVTTLSLSGTSTVTCTRCSILGGRATSTTVGASVGSQATLTVTNGTIEGSAAGSAGSSSFAIYSNGAVNVTNSTLRGGTASSASAGLRAVSASSVSISGATIEGGTSPNHIGVLLESVTSAQILSRSTIDAGTEPGATSGTCTSVPGACSGIAAIKVGHLEITGNARISGGTGATARGIYLSETPAAISNNTLILGRDGSWLGPSTQRAVGLESNSSTGLVIDANLIAGRLGDTCTGCTQTEGAFFSSSSGKLTNNVVIGGAGPLAYGVRGVAGQMSAWNNAIVAAQASTSSAEAFVLHLSGGATDTWNNNILVEGLGGATPLVYVLGLGSVASFRNNDLFRRGSGPVLAYSNGGPEFLIADVTGFDSLPVGTFTGNMAVDPEFDTTRPFHLTSTSPCLNAGLLDGAPTHDRDSEPRPIGAGVEIGPDELCTGVPVCPVVIGN